jgi:hypothetical protein
MTTGCRRIGKAAGSPAGPLSALVLLAVCLSGAGCGEKPAGPPLTAEPEAATPERSPADAAAEAEPAAPFEPPALADLERAVTWIDRPVRDALVVLREQQVNGAGLVGARPPQAGEVHLRREPDDQRAHPREPVGARERLRARPQQLELVSSTIHVG